MGDWKSSSPPLPLILPNFLPFYFLSGCRKTRTTQLGFLWTVVCRVSCTIITQSLQRNMAEGKNASIREHGRGNNASIREHGRGNNASIREHGRGNNASIREHGRGNNASISVNSIMILSVPYDLASQHSRFPRVRRRQRPDENHWDLSPCSRCAAYQLDCASFRNTEEPPLLWQWKLLLLLGCLTLNFPVQIKYEPHICKKSPEKWLIFFLNKFKFL